MIRNLLKRLTALHPQPVDPLDAMIARRGQRVSNRKPEVARAYERTHQVLARGKK